MVLNYSNRLPIKIILQLHNINFCFTRIPSCVDSVDVSLSLTVYKVIVLLLCRSFYNHYDLSSKHKGFTHRVYISR